MMTDLVLWYLWNALVFLFAMTSAFFIPGFILTRFSRLSFRPILRLVLIFALGISAFTFQGYLVGYMHARWLSFFWIVLSVAGALWLRKELRGYLSACVQTISRFPKILILLCLIGILVQSSQMVGSGLELPSGMPFFRVHSQDGIFHLSLIASIVRAFPPNEPGAFDLPVVNYHYWSDLCIAEIARIFAIPVHMLFFQFFPPLLSMLTALAVLLLLSELGKHMDRRSYRLWQFFSLFLLFFGGDLAYLVMLSLHGIWGFYTSAIDNGATQFLNMPHTFAKFLFFVSLWTFLRWRNTKIPHFAGYSLLLSSVLFGMKIYFGLLNAGILGLIALFELIGFLRKGKMDQFLLTLKSYLGYAVVAGICVAGVYLPANRGSGGLSWYPLEWVKLMIAEQNLDWKDLRYRIAIAEYLHLTGKLYFYNTVALFATILSIHGTRVVGFFLPVWQVGRERKFWIASLIMSFLFTLVGFSTLQDSGGFNVFNFFASSLAILALSGGLVLTEMYTSKHQLIRGLAIVFCVLSIPRIVYETGKILTSYQKYGDVVVIPKDELDALQFLSRQTSDSGLVQSHPDNALDMHTPYVAYFSDHFSFLSGVSVLETHNQPTYDRLNVLKKIFSTSDPNTFLQLLHQNGIGYLYLRSGESIGITNVQSVLTSIYSNNSVHVYKVQ